MHRTPPAYLCESDRDLRVLEKNRHESDEDMALYLIAADRADGLLKFQEEIVARTNALAQEIEDHLDRIDRPEGVANTRLLFQRLGSLTTIGVHPTHRLRRTLFRINYLWVAARLLLKGALPLNQGRDTTVSLLDQSKKLRAELRKIQEIARAGGVGNT